MTRTVLFLLILGNYNVCCQIDSSLYRIFITNRDSISNYNIFNGNVFLKKASLINDWRKKKKIMFLNGKAIDSTGFAVSVKYNRGYLTGYGYKDLYAVSERGVQRLNIQFSDTLRMEVDLTNIFLLANDLFIYEVDVINGRPKLLVDLTKIACSKKPCFGREGTEWVNSIFSTDNEHFVIQTCISDDEGPGCGLAGYYLYDRKGQKIEDIRDRVKSYSEESCYYGERTTIVLKSENNQNLRVYTRSTDDYYCPRSKMIDRYWLADNRMHFINEVLCLGEENFGITPPSISGICSTNENISYYYLLSNLDNKDQALVPYKFIPHLEIDLFKAFNDTLLRKEDLKHYGKYELGILRNLIFAKHNYDFTSEFYRAYFNLYCFYNDKSKRSTRLKNVNKLLTSVDKQNLKVIKDFESRFK